MISPNLLLAVEVVQDLLISEYHHERLYLGALQDD
jgi:hypothetical protein